MTSRFVGSPRCELWACKVLHTGSIPVAASKGLGARGSQPSGDPQCPEIPGRGPAQVNASPDGFVNTADDTHDETKVNAADEDHACMVQTALPVHRSSGTA